MRAMVLLAKNYKKKQLLSLKDISKQEIIPFDFLEKIILQLEKAGFVKGKKGVGGGYILLKDPKKITANDIVEALENTIPVNCFLCGRKHKCAVKSVWAKVDLALKKSLKSIKLSEFVK